MFYFSLTSELCDEAVTTLKHFVAGCFSSVCSDFVWQMREYEVYTEIKQLPFQFYFSFISQAGGLLKNP
jgi:hypothetical protein